MSESSSQNSENRHSLFINGIKLQMAKIANGSPWLVSIFLASGTADSEDNRHPFSGCCSN